MGHVFVVRADLLHVACDAWCVPGGFGPGGAWKGALPRASSSEMAAAFEAVDYRDDGRRVVRWPKPVAPPAPTPFLVNIVGGGKPASWYVEGARQFVEVAAAHLRDDGRPPLFGRAKHLLALPLVGTGGGGGGAVSGEVTRLLLATLADEAARRDVDVALVLFEGPAYAAAQAERRRAVSAASASTSSASTSSAYTSSASTSSASSPTDPFAELSPALRERADRLAALARRGDLVVFFGAGASQAAGLPSWRGLLEALAAERARLAPDEAAALSSLGELDRAALLQRRLGEAGRLGDVVAAHLQAKSTRYALPHALLASLPVDELVTTNYDDLFERASLDADEPVAVLPIRSAARGERWLLKMHGCVTRPSSIVLTREDYLRFQENRTALAGIVQALLLTRHMLFVGFSLADDNFHRIAHAVRSATRQDGGGPSRFGTALVVGGNSLSRELWADDVDWVSFAEAGDRAQQARAVEIFLDRVGCAAATATSHLCDPRYEGVLDDGEREVRALVDALVAGASPAAKATASWAEVERLLARLGRR